ncbi:Acyl-CoA desaturase [Leucoagaricus sp. SymC.cos]|nr:Acyl-CoA desaturase [Leucoagaricus sp. SymC.cos]
MGASLPDDYVPQALKTQKVQSPITMRNWYKSVNRLHFFIFIATHGTTLVGPWFISCRPETILFALAYGYLLGLGITAGYHRLWTHRSYNASAPLQYILAVLGGGAAQSDIEWWCRQHRVHHRYTDTDLDPYNARQGFWFSHIGWILFKPRFQLGSADISDLRNDPVVQWQRRNYWNIVVVVSVIIPGAIPWVCWAESLGACIVYAVAARMCFLFHVTFSVNSFAHWLGETTYDDKHTPRDHFITALLTLGEGYHNFHHEFPMDYRNAVEWYQYDPTKWFIRLCQLLRLASNLRVCPENEIRKSELTMQLKSLKEKQDGLIWPTSSSVLPVINWASHIVQEQSLKRPLIVIAGFIHDVSDFTDEHPGGREILVRRIGKDATAAFFGGVYDHSNAANNLLAMKRVGVLHGGVQPGSEERSTPPSQRLRIFGTR